VRAVARRRPRLKRSGGDDDPQILQERELLAVERPVGGFDDAGLAAALEPPLTTMHQPFDRISAEMVRLLLGVIDGDAPAAVTVSASLVVRSST